MASATGFEASPWMPPRMASVNRADSVRAAAERRVVLVVMVGWVLFRAESLTHLEDVVGGFFSTVDDDLAARLRAEGLPVQNGIFGADMAVRLVNDGPVTIWPSRVIQRPSFSGSVGSAEVM